MKTPNRHSDDVSTHKRRTYYTLYIYVYIYIGGGGVAVILLSVPTRAHKRIYIYLPHFPPRESSVFITAVLHIYADTCGYNTYLYSMYVQLV